MPKATTSPSTPTTSPSSTPDDVLDRARLIEHALNTIVLIGLALVEEMRARKKHNVELCNDLDASVQWLARSIQNINEEEDIKENVQ